MVSGVSSFGLGGDFFLEIILGLTLRLSPFPLTFDREAKQLTLRMTIVKGTPNAGQLKSHSNWNAFRMFVSPHEAVVGASPKALHDCMLSNNACEQARLGGCGGGLFIPPFDTG